MEFLNDINNLVNILSSHFKIHYKQELTTTLLLSMVLTLTIVVQLKTKFLLQKKFTDKKYSNFLILNDLVFPLLFLIIIKKAAGMLLEGNFGIILFNSIAYYYLAYFIIRNARKVSTFQYLPWEFISNILIILAVICHLFINLYTSFYKQTDLYLSLSLVLKVSLIFLFFIFLIRGLKFIPSVVPEKLRSTAKAIEQLIPYVSILYILISALWLLKIITITSAFFTGIIVTIILVTLYIFLNAYLTSFFNNRFDSFTAIYDEINKNIKSSLKFILIYALYKAFSSFFNFSVLIKYLDQTYLLNTDLVKISIFSVISAVYLFLLLYYLMGIIQNISYLFYIRRGKDVEAGSLKAIVSNVGLLVILLFSLAQVGLNWKVLIPFAGALGIGLGFGLQTIMNNYISGFILLFSRKLKVGDIIEIQGNAGRAIGNTLETIYGKVESIDILSTTVQTTDGIEIVVPNSQFLSNQIINYSLSDSNIRVRIPFGVSYSSDPNTVKDLLLAAAKEHKQILDTPQPNVWFSEYGDSALIFYLLFWVDIRLLWRINPLISETYFKAWYELEKSGVVIPFPQRDVWFKNNLKIEIDKEQQNLLKGD